MMFIAIELEKKKEKDFILLVLLLARIESN